MFKLVVFGSCLSNLTARWLVQEYKCVQTHCVHHNRSDSFVRYFVDKSAEMIPLPLMERFLVDSPAYAHDARSFLYNQHASHVGYFELDALRIPGRTLFDDLRSTEIDIILLDNYMDVAACLMEPFGWEGYEDSALFLNPHMYANEAEIYQSFRFGAYLTPAESAMNWRKIYMFLRHLQPRAKIYFLSFMSCTSGDNPSRQVRADAFYVAYCNLMQGEDITLLPPLALPEALHTPGNWSHVDMRVYRALAGAVFLDATAMLRLPGKLHETGAPESLTVAA